MSRSRSSSTTKLSGGSSGGSSSNSRFGEDATTPSWDQMNTLSPSASRKNSDGSSHLVPGSPSVTSERTSFIAQMIRKDSGDSSASDTDSSAQSSSGQSSSHSSPIQPPLPPPGFQPPIAFNPAAQILVRQSSGSNSGSGGRTSSGDKSRSRGKDDRRSSDPATSMDKSPSNSFSSGGSGSSGSGPSGSLRPALLRARSEASNSSSASSTSVSPPSTIPASPSTMTPMRYPTSAQPGSGSGSGSSSSSGGNGTNQTRDLVAGGDPSSHSSSTMTPPNASAQPSTASGSGGGSGGSGGSGGGSGGTGYNTSYNGRSQTSLDLISSTVFSANGFSTPLNPPLPQRSNSEAWDSVWPATSPYAVPHLPAVAAPASSHGSSTHSGSSKSGSNSSGSKVSSGSSPSLGASTGLGSPMGFSLVMSPSAPYPPNALKSTRHSSSAGGSAHKRTPSVSSPIGPPSSSSGGSASSSSVGKGSPFLGLHTEFDSPKGKTRMELSLPQPRANGGAWGSASPRLSDLARPSRSPTPSPPVTPTTETPKPPHAVAPADLLGAVGDGGDKTPVNMAPTPPVLHAPASPVYDRFPPRNSPSGAFPPHLPQHASTGSMNSPRLPAQIPPLKSPRPVSVGLPLPGFLDNEPAPAQLTPPLPFSPPAQDNLARPSVSLGPSVKGSKPVAPAADLSATFHSPDVRVDGKPGDTPAPPPTLSDTSPLSPLPAAAVEASPSPPDAASPISPPPVTGYTDETARPPADDVARPDVDNPFFPPTSASPPPDQDVRPGDVSPPVEPFDAQSTEQAQDDQAYLSVTEDMDIDDEGLTTLERIFLLSKSEFTHHRIFISRVIGDWVEDVDPCETVEYVLPLLNSLGTDEDESVREALAPSLHKILWFFYSTCRLITEDDDPLEAAAQDEGPSTLTITSEGFDLVARPTLDDVQQAPPMQGIPADLLDPLRMGPNSGGSSESTPGSVASTPGSVFSDASSTTPGSTVASEDTDGTQVSDRDQECYLQTAYDEDDVKAYMQPVRKPRPVISVQTFTPLIGSLLMSHSSLVCEAAKAAIIGILARLRNVQLPSYEPWPERHIDVGQSKTYYAQTGVHIHEHVALTPEEKKIIQDELLNAIVVGMAKLDETQSPYDPEDDENRYVEGDGSAFGGGYFNEGETDGARTVVPDYDDAFGEYAEDGERRRLSSPELAHAHSAAQNAVGQVAPDLHDQEEAVAEDETAPLEPLPQIVPPQVLPEQGPTAPLSPSTAPGNPDLASGPVDDLPSDAELYPSTDFDSPNAPPVDHRSYSEVAAYEEDNPQRTDPPPEFDQNNYTEELSVEASHGRLLSMNLIAAVVECGVLAEEDVATRLFVPEVVRMRFDESYAVRREAALAMAELLKVVPQEIVMESLLTLFDAFAVDENPHVRQAACLALPALTRHLHPYAFKKEHTIKVLPGFFSDETKEIQNTALEVLGELIYAFHDEDEGLPTELIDYFLGPPRPKKEPRSDDGTLNIFSTAKGLSLLSGLDDEADYRQIVCAFNFPAVTLTAGREGWPLLRAYYLELTEEPQVQVRRSLAASLHEMAKILGDEIASADLVPFFHRCLEDEYEIRERLWENLHVFIGALDQVTAWPLIHKIGQLLVAGQLSNWRLRERLMQSLPSMAESMIAGQNGKYLVVSLLRQGLIDKVAAVRDAAIGSIPALYATTRKVDNPETRHEVDEVMRALAVSPHYRQRRTFVRCMETFMDVEYDHDLVLERCIPELLKVNEDPIVDVRFALANYVVRMCGADGYCPDFQGAPAGLMSIANSLHNDESFDVRHRVAELFPDVEVTRRPSAATSVASSAPASPPRPPVRRTSSSGSTGSSTPNVPLRSPGTPTLDNVHEAAESILQLENVPSPQQSPKVIPGYELHGFAFEQSTSKEEALKVLGETQGLGLNDGSVPDGGSATPTPQPVESRPTDYFPPASTVSSL